MTTDNGAAEDKKPLNIFIGSKGLRAGWGVLLFIAVFAALGFGVVMLAKALHIAAPGADDMTPTTVLAGEGIQAGLVVVATLITALIERRPLSQIGLGTTNAVPRFLQGLLLGFVALSAVIGVLWLCHAFVFDGIALHGKDIWIYGVEWLGAFLLVGINEEFMFRVYLQQTLARGLNYTVAAVIMGVLFFIAHMGNGGETPIGLGEVFSAGVLLSVAIWRTGTVWWSIGFHAAWDWAQSYVYGVADSGLVSKGALMASHPMGPAWLSGGTTGPEGSIVSIIVTLVAAILIWFMAPKQDVKLRIRLLFEKEPPAPQQDVF